MATVTSGAGHKWRAQVENGVLLERPTEDCPEWLCQSLIAHAHCSDKLEQELNAMAQAGIPIDTSGT